ncbi:MAG: methylated-DNA--[protein]-cysteine S-methyltransferase [Thermodesulfobacteriota bacterium]
MEMFIIFQTLFGWCGLVSGELGMKKVLFGYNTSSSLKNSLKKLFPEAKEKQNGLLERGKIMISEYLLGKRLLLDLPYETSNYTSFQRMVWETTKTIPYGETRTYGWVSQKLSKPFAFRAVGQALAVNPLPLIIPCHRVIRADGKLGGFSLPGSSYLKERIIELERLQKEVFGL